MPKFMFAYHGGSAPETPEDGAKAMAAWEAWMKDLGDALVEGGAPVGMSSTLSAEGLNDGGGANPISGFSIVQAETVEAAAALGKSCPIFSDPKATIEIAPILEM